jgi:AcrR family transcriptional regulator
MARRDPFTAPEVASRRGGPIKQPLSRDAIVTEALRQLATDGLKGMSLRKVAAALETGPASLYAYVQDLEELHALMLDRALAKVNVCGDGNDSWREQLLRVLESYWHVLSASPGLAQIAFGSVAIGPNTLRMGNALLELLHGHGLDATTRAWAVDLLLLYVTANAAEKAAGFDAAAMTQEFTRALDRVSERDYPHVFAVREQLVSGGPETRFMWALDVILEGILQKARARVTDDKSGRRCVRGRATPSAPQEALTRETLSGHCALPFD